MHDPEHDIVSEDAHDTKDNCIREQLAHHRHEHIHSCRLQPFIACPELDLTTDSVHRNQKNTVMLGNADQLETEYMLAEQDKMVDERELFGCENLTVRIRYRSRPIPCRVKRLEDGRLLIRFLEIASAIAPGQSAVFYDGKRVLGGAFIASQRGIGLVIMENEEL